MKGGPKSSLRPFLHRPLQLCPVRKVKADYFTKKI